MIQKISFIACAFFTIFFSCKGNHDFETIKANELFSISYGKFDDELNMFSLSSVGAMHTNMTMRDGFFYIANGEAKKIMEMNSYGDLLTIFYNTNETDQERQSDESASLRKKAIRYPFNNLGAIAVDSRKHVYVASEMPKERQEKDGGLLYSQVVLKFSRDGESEDFIGQQGLGSMPFPFIKNIYTTRRDELVVVCVSTGGLIVYWFSEAGKLLYEAPIIAKELPSLKDAPNAVASMPEAIPDCEKRKLFVKVDYYAPRIDFDSKAETGIDYVQTRVYALDIEKGMYDEGISIPPYEETVVKEYDKLIFRLPFDFLGAVKGGWLFFMIANDKGFSVQAVNVETGKTISRNTALSHKDLLYSSFSLSDAGILSALLINDDKAHVVWYHFDSLLAPLPQ